MDCGCTNSLESPRLCRLVSVLFHHVSGNDQPLDLWGSLNKEAYRNREPIHLKIKGLFTKKSNFHSIFCIVWGCLIYILYRFHVKSPKSNSTFSHELEKNYLINLCYSCISVVSLNTHVRNIAHTSQNLNYYNNRHFFFRCRENIIYIHQLMAIMWILIWLNGCDLDDSIMIRLCKKKLLRYRHNLVNE